jgi:hypothetical protein
MAKRKQSSISSPRSAADDRGGVAAPPEEIVTSPQATGDTTAAPVDRERIASRAYELYCARGCEEGHDVDDWLKAERELTRPARSGGSEPLSSPSAWDGGKDPILGG